MAKKVNSAESSEEVKEQTSSIQTSSSEPASSQKEERPVKKQLTAEEEVRKIVADLKGKNDRLRQIEKEIIADNKRPSRFVMVVMSNIHSCVSHISQFERLMK